jgi:MscS family membrane protein
MTPDWADKALNWLGTHPLVYVAVLLVAALAGTWAVNLIFTRVIRRFTQRTSTHIDDAIVRKLQRPVMATVFVIFLNLALRLLIEDQYWQTTACNVLWTVVLVWWVLALVQAFRVFSRAVMRSKSRETSGIVQVMPLVDNLVTVVLVLLGAFWLLDMWQINITPLIASAGIATAALALASKDTLSNFFGGVSIFMDRPYRLGDYIILGTGERGEVVDIGVRSTRILTRDDVLVTIPNSVMANAKIINETQPAPMYRVRSKVGVSYDSDPDLVEENLLKSLENISAILPQPVPRVRFRSFGDSALDFELLSWVSDPRDREGCSTRSTRTS